MRADLRTGPGAIDDPCFVPQHGSPGSRYQADSSQACPLRARQEGRQGGITGTHGQGDTASDLERSRSEGRVPRSCELVGQGFDSPRRLATEGQVTGVR